MQKKFDIRPFKSNNGQFKLKTCRPTQQAPQCLCQLNENSKTVMSQCSKCRKKYHDCLRNFDSPEGLCCYCIARNIDPRMVVEKVLTEGYFGYSDVTKYENRVDFEFELENYPPGFEIGVRCFRAREDKIGFPMLGTILLNDKQEKVLRPLIANSNLKRRKDQPIILTQSNLRKGGSLNIMSFHAACVKREMKDQFQLQPPKIFYFVGIYLLRIRTLPELQSYLRRSSYITKEGSKKKFFSDHEGLAFCGEKQNLQCPMTLSIIQFPIRGEFCTHFQVFCLRSLFKLEASKNGRWYCPICSKRIFEPVLDLWVDDIIRSTPERQDLELMFQADGSFEWLTKKDQVLPIPLQIKPPTSRATKKKKVKIQESTEQPSEKVLAMKRTNEILLDDLEECEVLSVDSLEMVNEDGKPLKEKSAGMSKKSQAMINKKNRIEAIIREDSASKIIQAIPNTKSTRLNFKDLSKLMDNLRMSKKTIKPKQLSDQLPMLFKWHLK